MNNKNTPALTEQELEELLKKRSNFISIKAKIARLIGPKIFQLQLENFSNTRNSIIVAGALATIGLLILNNSQIFISITSNISLQVAVIGFLLTVLLYSLYLIKGLSGNINLYQKKFDENVTTADEAEDIINNCLDGRISKSEADKKLLKVYKEIEFERIRVATKETAVGEKYLIFAQIGNVLFAVSILLLVLAFILNYYDFLMNLLIQLVYKH